MRKYFFLPVISLVVVLLLGFGCGKSKNPTEEVNGNAIDSLLREAYQAMVESNFTRADSLYGRVLQLDNGNSKAAFGKATCSIFLLQDDPGVDSLIGYFEQFGDSLYLPKMGHMPKLGADFPLRICEGAYSWVNKPFNGQPYTISDFQDFVVARVFPVLEDLSNLFEIIETDRNFVFTIYPDLCQCQDTIEIDLGEIYAAHAQVNLTHAILNYLVSYNMDLDTYETCLSDILADSSSFMTLKPAGAIRMPQAKNYLLDGIELCSLAVDFIAHETDDQSNDLIVLDQEDGDSIYYYLGKGRQSLIDTLQVQWSTMCQGNPISFTVALGEFFDNPIQDYKDYLPPHHFADGCNDLKVDSVYFDDPTFSGLFPEMANSDWQYFFDCDSR